MSSSIPEATIPKTKRGRARREQLLRAAEDVFVEFGFHGASISEITKRANTAQGSFYNYFESKEQIFCELTLDLARWMRSRLSERIQDVSNRMDAERVGLEAYLTLIKERPAVHHLAQEARFVSIETFRQIYDEFLAGYALNLKAGVAAGDMRGGDLEVRGLMLMAVAQFFGEHVTKWENPVDDARIVKEVMSVMSQGMKT